MTLLFACLASAGQADLFRGLMVNDFANVRSRALGDPLVEQTNAQGVTQAEYQIDGEQRVLIWHGADARIMALRAEEYRSTAGIEIGVTSLGALLPRIGGRDAMAIGHTAMLPSEGRWTWRITWPVAGVPREYLQLTFADEALAQGQPSTHIPESATLSAIMVMSMSIAAQSLDLAALNRADQRRVGRMIRDLLNE